MENAATGSAVLVVLLEDAVRVTGGAEVKTIIVDPSMVVSRSGESAVLRLDSHLGRCNSVVKRTAWLCRPVCERNKTLSRFFAAESTFADVAARLSRFVGRC